MRVGTSKHLKPLWESGWRLAEALSHKAQTFRCCCCCCCLVLWRLHAGFDLPQISGGAESWGQQGETAESPAARRQRGGEVVGGGMGRRNGEGRLRGGSSLALSVPHYVPQAAQNLIDWSDQPGRRHWRHAGLTDLWCEVWRNTF